MRLQAPLDSVSITVTSQLMKFTFYQNCYQFRTSYLITLLRRSSLSVRVFASTLMLSVPLGAGSGACSPWRSCDCSRHSCYPLQVTLCHSCYPLQMTLCPGSVFQFCSPKFQTHKTTQLLIETLACKTLVMPRSTFR